jgi:plasmid stabilization system protein ParE
LVGELDSALDAAVDYLCAFPSAAKSVDAAHRSHRIRRFPYLLIYRLENEEIVVVAFAHAARMPGYWLNRTGKPQS